MGIHNAIEITMRYAFCPICGSEKIGNGNGSLNIGDTDFRRSCKCGWTVIGYVDAEENIIEMDNNSDMLSAIV